MRDLVCKQRVEDGWVLTHVQEVTLVLTEAQLSLRGAVDRGGVVSTNETGTRDWREVW